MSLMDINVPPPVNRSAYDNTVIWRLQRGYNTVTAWLFDSYLTLFDGYLTVIWRLIDGYFVSAEARRPKSYYQLWDGYLTVI